MVLFQATYWVDENQHYCIIYGKKIPSFTNANFPNSTGISVIPKMMEKHCRMMYRISIWVYFYFTFMAIIFSVSFVTSLVSSEQQSLLLYGCYSVSLLPVYFFLPF